MAIYRFEAQAISRSAGRSATAAAAYRAAARVVDERTGEIHDYRRKRGVMHAEVVLPESAGEWARDRSDLWSAVEQAEKRKDACVAREYVIALPCELTREQQIALVTGWARQQAAETGAAYDVCVHEADDEGDHRNVHAHVMRTTRAVLADGLSPVKLAIEQAGRQRRAELVELRKSWSDAANQALAEAGRPERIDHRSLVAQGITDREPGVHMGPARTNMLRKAERIAREAVAEVERLQAELASAVAERASAAAAAAVAAVAAVAPLAAAAEPAPAPERQAAAVPAVRRVVVAPAPVRQAAPVVPQARQVAAEPVRQAAVPAPAPVRWSKAAPAPAPAPAAALDALRRAQRDADARSAVASMCVAQLGDPRGRLVELRKSLSDAQIERAALEQQISRRSWIERVAARLGDPDAERVAELRRQAQDIGRQIAETTALVPAADQAAEAARSAARAAKAAQAAVKAAEAALQAAQAQADRIARRQEQGERPPERPRPTG